MQKEENSKKSKSGYSVFGESYASLILGIIVIIIGTLVLISFARTRNARRVDDTTSIPEGITEITQTNMETVIRSVTHAPRMTSTPIPTIKPTKMPESKKSPTTPEKTNKKETKKYYTVVKGDSLWSISEKNYKSGYNWVNIQRANKLSNPNELKIGTKLILPKIEQKNISFVEKNSNNEVNFGNTEKISGSSYVIQEGDNLWNIALRAYGDGFKWVNIQRANKLSNPDLIYPDVVLQLPR